MIPVLERLNDANVRYLVIGGQAMRLEGLPRFTMDWDLFIPPRDEDNFQKLNEALKEWLDGPVLPLGKHGENFVQTYQTPWGVLQFHLAPPGLRTFAEVAACARVVVERGVSIQCVGSEDLLRSKEAVGRPQDQQDIELLKRKYAKPETL